MIFARAFAALIVAAALLAGGSAAAQTYPTRPVTIIVPFPPGGATDAIARMLQDALAKSLGQPVVLDNVGGAGGMIAAARAARAEPDGYTVIIHQVALAAGMSLYKNLSFDAVKDFTPVGLINTAASTWAARADLPPKSFDEMVRWMKEPGRNVKVAHPGVGSFGHLVGVLVAQELGVPVTQVPYRGGGPALNDLLGGQVDLSSQSAVQSAQLIKAGKIKGYAIIGRTRYAGLPELRTMGELGYKKLDIDFWHMLLVPQGTPRPVVDRLNAALREALVDERVKKAFADGGMDAFPASEQTPEAAAALLKNAIALWGEVIRTNNITAQ
ncbi:MAG: tripartite tricarboxylate transporter substrate binding protein [Variibacter sp.]|nr:tripartite tricarboxylate transporter substrate binding protein [Variibacter sp.]